MANLPWDLPPSIIESEPVLGVPAWDTAKEAASELEKTLPLQNYKTLNIDKNFLFYSSIYFLEHVAAAIEFDQPKIFGDFYSWTSSVLTARNISDEILVGQITVITNLLKTKTPKIIFDKIVEITETRVPAGFDPIRSTEDNPGIHHSSKFPESRQKFLDGLLKGNRQEAFGVIELLIEEGFKLEDICLDVIHWAMYEVGERWEKNQIMWTEERMATAICQYTLSMIFTQALETRRISKISCPVFLVKITPEQHDLGLWIISDIIGSHGIEVTIAKNKLDLNQIKKDIKKLPKSIIGFSVTLMPHLIYCHKTIQSIRKANPENDLKILVGGQAFARSGLRAQQIDADLVINDAKQLMQEITPLL